MLVGGIGWKSVAGSTRLLPAHSTRQPVAGALPHLAPGDRQHSPPKTSGNFP